jgi:methylmalonyl-CoA/ethylmalonyl-CoA epimerase
MATRIHHINFLVRELEPAVEKYRVLLDCGDVHYEDLPSRGVRTARFRMGETWVVLVQPVDPQGVPARRLAENGEGFFLVSYGVDDLDAASGRARRAGVKVLDREPRRGLSGWRVRDLDDDDLFGVATQFTAAD